MSIVRLVNMKIVTRIILSFLIILVLSIATFGFLINEIKHIESTLEELYRTFIVTNNSIAAEKIIYNIDSSLKDVISALEKRNEGEALSKITELYVTDVSFKEHLTEIKKWIQDEIGKNILTEIEELFKDWDTTEAELLNNVKENDFATASYTISSTKDKFKKLISMFALMNVRAKDIANNSYKETHEFIKEIVLISVIISLILFIIAVFIAVFISRNISRSLSFFKEIFSKGASGYLNTSYPVRNRARDEINELGLLFNRFVEKVRGVIKEVVDASNELSTSSEELSVTITNFSDNSQSQAASSEEITATMEEISAGIDNVSDNSQYQFSELNELIKLIQELSGIINEITERISDAQGLSKDITEQAKSGNESLNLMNNSMAKITESSNKVSDIIEIIDDISNKINLLSLNAAIEAARAGEAGRGFAVVADEISKLADQTASSINDIDSLIKKNNNEISSGMMNIVDSIESISKIIEGVQSIDTMMNKIITYTGKQQSTNMAVNKSADNLRIRSDEVRSASEEQKNAVGEAMKSITNINDLLQTSASGAEQMNANASRLAFLADNLKDKVSFFNISV